MSLFICFECGCIENTNCCHHGVKFDDNGNKIKNGFRNWGIMQMYGWRDEEHREKKNYPTHMLCSECNTGTWHNEWEKSYPNDIEIAMANDLEDKVYTSHPLYKKLEKSNNYTLKQFEEDNKNRKLQDKIGKKVKKSFKEHTSDMSWMYQSHEPYIREEPKIGRNSICLCGSGKKYKKCCKDK